MTVNQILEWIDNNKQNCIFGLVDLGPFSELFYISERKLIAVLKYKDADTFVNAYIDNANDLILG